MAKFSREKGRRGEQQLVLYLASKFWKAERILNQAHTKGLPDVKATKNDKTYTFENKCYKDRSKDLYTYWHIWNADPVCMRLSETMCCAVSKDFETLLSPNDMKFYGPTNKFEVRLFRKMITFNKERGDADFLVLKDNNRARLFIRYWV